MQLAPNETHPSALDSILTESMSAADRRVSERASRASRARHASQRRQKIDPTTCERDYSRAELEFMQAIQAYKIASGRMFPTWSEVLEVLQSLGYQKSA
jgi:hypothetical protein